METPSPLYRVRPEGHRRRRRDRAARGDRERGQRRAARPRRRDHRDARHAAAHARGDRGARGRDGAAHEAPQRSTTRSPRSLDAAIAPAGATAATAQSCIAGGQSLGPMLNLRLAQPELLVDVRGMPELARGRATTATPCSSAPASTHAAIEDGAVPDPTRGLAACGGARRSPIARCATAARSAAASRHADPAADWVNVLALLDAEIVASRARDGERRIRASRVRASAPFTTALAADEIITGVRVPQALGARALGPLQVLPQARRVRRGDRRRRRTIRSAALRAP